MSVQFACNCESDHYVGCPNADNLVTSPSGDVSLQGYNLQITPQPGVSVEQQATQACKTHCDTKCDTRKTIVDTVGYNKRAIFDAMGWDSHKPAPYERWALVGPTIVPSGSSIAYTMLAILFILFAIGALVRSAQAGEGGFLGAVNAIVAAYFGPIYLAIAYISKQPKTFGVPMAAMPVNPAMDALSASADAPGASEASLPLLAKLAGGAAAILAITLLLDATGAINLQPSSDKDHNA